MKYVLFVLISNVHHTIVTSTMTDERNILSAECSLHLDSKVHGVDAVTLRMYVLSWGLGLYLNLKLHGGDAVILRMCVLSWGLG